MRGYERDLVTGCYAEFAEEYAVTYGDDMAELAVNRRVLDEVARRVGRGLAADVGCGPAQVGRYLADAGCRVVGLDPTAAMLAVARARNPGLPLAAGEIGALPLRPGACAAVVAFYVLHHVPRPDLPATLAGIRRALAPGGTFAFATHEGEGTFTATGTEVVGTLYTEAELAGLLAGAGYRVDGVEHRDSLPHEREGTRILVTATAVGPTA